MKTLFPFALSAFAVCMALGSGACTTSSGSQQKPLDKLQWRSAKSRMYQDLARQCLQAAEHDKALQLLQQAVQFDPADVQTLELLARLATADGNLVAAGAAAQMLLRVEPESATGWCTLGAIAETQDDLATAETAYRRSMLAHRDDPRPAVDLHRLLLGQHREAEAAVLRADVTARFPDRVEVLLDHGAWLAESKRWSEAADAFGSALATRPAASAAATGVALSALMSQRPATTLALRDRLPPRARTGNAALQLALATAHLQSGDPEAALRELDVDDQALRDKAAIRVLRGEILFELQRLDAAGSEFERAITLDDDATRAHTGLGRVCLLQGRAHAAVRSLQRAVQLRPGNAAAVALLAAALAATGDDAGARQKTDALRALPGSSALVAELERLHPGVTGQAAEGKR